MNCFLFVSECVVPSEAEYTETNVTIKKHPVKNCRSIELFKIIQVISVTRSESAFRCHEVQLLFQLISVSYRTASIRYS